MKRFIHLFTLTLSLLVLSSVSFGASAVKVGPPTETIQFAGIEDLTVEEFLALTPNSTKEKTGKKLSLKETIILKKAQKKLEKAMNGNAANGKSQLVALILVIFIGYLGIHRFYLGYTAIGIIQLLTLGGCGSNVPPPPAPVNEDLITTFEMRKGFELLRSRPYNQKVSFDTIESSIQIEIPPIFRVYHESFLINEMDSSKFLSYIREDGVLMPFQSIYHIGFEEEELSINEMISFDDLSQYVQGYKDYLEHDYPEGTRYLFFDKKLLPVSNCENYDRYGGGIGVGTQKGEVDKIILIRSNDSGHQSAEVIANNVFEFVRGMTTFLPWDEPDLKTLYRNWNEPFWRIRGE